MLGVQQFWLRAFCGNSSPSSQKGIIYKLKFSPKTGPGNGVGMELLHLLVFTGRFGAAAPSWRAESGRGLGVKGGHCGTRWPQGSESADGAEAAPLQNVFIHLY